MGNKVVTFTEEQLEDYQDCTFFTRKEILRVQKKFYRISSDTVPRSMVKNEASTITIPLNMIEKLPELKENPFRTRICQVFSKDGSGNQTFEDFLDMLSVFSEQATRDMKVFYAFKIYDFDNDNHIGSEDICTALRLLTHNELSGEEMAQVYEKAMEEGDVDGDGKLSFIEFHHTACIIPLTRGGHTESRANFDETFTVSSLSKISGILESCPREVGMESRLAQLKDAYYSPAAKVSMKR